MMTQTHSLIAATLLASPKSSARHNVAILLGSFVPDLAIYCLFFWSKFKGIPEKTLWNEIYFTEPMLTFTAIGNSLPLYTSILLIVVSIAVIQDKRFERHPISVIDKTNYWAYINSSVMALFALAAITHLFGDFPVHARDAHPHFWPITDWRFESPVSYWDHNHHGQFFSLFEAVLGLILSTILFHRFKSLAIRALTGLAIISYIVVPVYFSLAI